MNFRTTLILMIVLIGAVTFFIVANRTSEQGNETAAGTDNKPRKLLDLSVDQINRLVISPSEGAPAGAATLEMTKAANGDWSIVKPFSWKGAQFEAGEFVRQLLDLRVRAPLPLSADNAATTGLNKPRYRVQFSGPSGKSATLAIGNRSVIGNDLYVIANSEKVGSVVAAGALNDKFDKGIEKLATSIRDKQLVRISSPEVKQFEIDRGGGRKLVLHKIGEEWKVVSPSQVPADNGEVSSLLYSVTGIRADEFADETAAASSGAGLDKPRLTVSLSSAAPSTQPTTQPVPMTVLTFGQATDIEADKTWVRVSDPASIAKASFPQASLQSLASATPTSLRDKKVLTIDPEKVTKISVSISRTAPPPATSEAVSSTVVLERTRQQMGPVEPTTMPATTQSTTQAASQPVAPPSKWNVASKGGVDADDTKVDDLLRELNPLRADKFHETAPTTQPSATITLAVETTDARHEIRLIDPGEGKALNGAYNGLSFEVPRFVLEKMEADFAKAPR